MKPSGDVDPKGHRAGMSIYSAVSILFVFAAIVGFANERWFALPRSIVLLIASLVAALGVLGLGAVTGLTALASVTQGQLHRVDLPRVLLDGILAVLLFAASLDADLRGLRKHAPAVLVLATAGVIVATAVFTVCIWAAFRAGGLDVPMAWCFVLGAIVAPTDSVAVEGILKHLRLPPSLRHTIAGESLFNDGTAVVVFLAALAVASGEQHVIGHGRIVVDLVVDSLGGATIGVVLGVVAVFGIRRVRAPEVVVTISIALALASYRLAIETDLSGPIAVIAAGLTVANWHRADHDAPVLDRATARLWAAAFDILNTLLFMLMGLEILALDLRDALMPAVLAAAPLAVLSRWLSVVVPVYLLPLGLKDRGRASLALTWTGLRGAVSIALVLTLPPGPYQPVLAAACYAVVLFTVIVQGLTIPRVLARLYGVQPPPDAPPHGPRARRAPLDGQGA